MAVLEDLENARWEVKSVLAQLANKVFHSDEQISAGEIEKYSLRISRSSHTDKRYCTLVLCNEEIKEFDLTPVQSLQIRGMENRIARIEEKLASSLPTPPTLSGGAKVPTFFPNTFPTPAKPEIDITQMSKKNDDPNAQRYTLVCSCDKHFGCEHIAELFASGADARIWWPKLAHRDDTWITLGVPVFDSVLHRIEMKLVTIQDWEDNDLKKVHVRSRCTGDPSRFYEPSKTGHISKIASDQIEILASTVTQSIDGEKTVSAIYGLMNGHFDQLSVCSSIVRKVHTMGDTKRLIDWIKAEDSERRVLANAFCLINYGICYMCHLDAEPTYSLITNL